MCRHHCTPKPYLSLGHLFYDFPAAFSSKSKIPPSRPQTQKAGPSLDLQSQDLGNLQRPFDNAAAQNYRVSDPIKSFGSETSNIKGAPSLPAQETQHHPLLTHSGGQGVLSKESLQGPHIQDLNMVALQQQQQQVLVKPLKPLARLKSSSTKATTTTTTTKVVPTFWFNTTKTPTTTKTTSRISTIMESKQQIEAFGGGLISSTLQSGRTKSQDFHTCPCLR